MEKPFNRLGLTEALDAIGTAATANGTRLTLAIYGGGALMLAGNFRFATEDVDIAEIGDWPDWLNDVVARVARERGWSDEWLNEAVTFHLSPLATTASDHHEYGTYPRVGPIGLSVIVPCAEYMLALKLKAMRTTDAVKGAKETDDIFQLMRVIGIDSADAAMQVLARYFPASTQDTAKQRFLLKHLTPSAEAKSIDAPHYAGRGLPPRAGG